MAAKNLSSKLGIKSGNKVCVIRANPAVLAQVKEQVLDMSLVENKVEKGCDVVLYWFDPAEDIRARMKEVQDKIKPDGRVWVIIPKKDVVMKRNLNIDWQTMQREVLKTKLVDNKIASINAEEYGTQFVIRKEWRR